MKIEYKRDLQNNYVILEASENTEEDSYRLRMAEQNEIPGLLPFHSSKRDGNLYLRYEITSKQSVENLYARNTMKYQDILFILNGICDILDALQKYLLSPSQLVFDPQLVYANPDRNRIFLCYLPGENESPITVLAEFMLKRLDHEDAQAVALGYQFYQKSLEENFSLQKTLKEILMLSGGECTEKERKQTETENERRYREEEQRTRMDMGTDVPQKEEAVYHVNRRAENAEADTEDNIYISGKKQKEHSGIRKAADWVFERIHPAVLLSALFLFAVLEAAFYFGILTLTETGGIFFLIVSVEALANQFWKNRKEKDKHSEEWWAEDSDEEYQKLQQEVYQESEQNQRTVIEETRWLAPESEQEGLRLVCLYNLDRGYNGPGNFSDIYVEKDVLYIGKIKGESDVVLDVPTVSRMHARLEVREGKYYVKDLNSKNGTFVNGRRLKPQEQCEIAAGDYVAFAAVKYQAMKI